MSDFGQEIEVYDIKLDVWNLTLNVGHFAI